MPPTSKQDLVSEAIISADRKYRYKLVRSWASDSAPLIWIMLNPSTADASRDDPTIRRCVSFAKGWGFGGVEIYNLFALRSNDPKRIELASDPIGPENDTWLKSALRTGGTVITAWGQCATKLRCQRASEVATMISRKKRVRVVSLGFTKGGQPRHPLYVRGDAPYSRRGNLAL
jgi:hypothetical protein